MKKLRQYSMALVATTGLVTIVLLVTGWGSAVAAQVTSVFITNNGASQAVPVHEQGTASVSVANTVPTKASDNPALQPVEQTEAFTLASGESGGGGTVYTVPGGKRLVIETASVVAQLPTTQQAVANLLINLAGATGHTGPGIGVFVIPMALQFDNGSGAVSNGALGSHMYADAGTTVDVSIGRSDGTGTGTFTVAIAGYLVNTP
jgi:hypothetical protein